MKTSRVVVTLLLGVIVVGGCRREEPEQPVPVVQPQTDDEAARRAAEEEAARRRAAEEEARRRAAEEARLAAERERRMTVLEQRIHFDYDESTVKPEYRDMLLEKASILRDNPAIRMRIEGHADERGSIEYNLALGMRRANAARDFLVNYGLEESRFQTQSRGEEQPLVPGASESAYAQNRRAEFDVIAGAIR